MCRGCVVTGFMKKLICKPFSDDYLLQIFFYENNHFYFNEIKKKTKNL